MFLAAKTRYLHLLFLILGPEPRPKETIFPQKYLFELANKNVLFMFCRSKSSAVLVLRKPVDYDAGDRTFNLTIKAEVSAKFLQCVYCILSSQALDKLSLTNTN